MISPAFVRLSGLSFLSTLLFAPLPHDHGDDGDDDGGGHHSTKLFTAEDSTHGNLEGVASDSHSDSFFVGATGDGTIYRGTLDHSTLEVFVPGSKGASAVGMKAAHGRLYVAGGVTGTLTVLDTRSGATLAKFDTGPDGFVNDLVVTEHGDVFLTDSFRPVLWHVTAEEVEDGAGAPEAIPVAPEIPYTADAFNLNGIVSLHDDRELVVVNTADGNLYRIELGGGRGDDDDDHRDDDDHGDGGERRITRIDVEPLLGGDGLLVDGGHLLVVQGGLNALAFVHLHDHERRGEVEELRTDPSLRGPSTVARLHDRYLIVNADFATSATPFTVSGLGR